MGDDLAILAGREKTILEDPNFMAMAARASYTDRWRKAGLSDRSDLPGVYRDSWKYDPELSDMRRAVWWNKYINTAIISYKGTSFKSPEEGAYGDLTTDYYIALEPWKLEWTPIFTEDIKNFKRVQAKYPGVQIEVTGHSLGGTRAEAISRREGVKGVGYNTGSSPLNLGGWWRKFKCWWNDTGPECHQFVNHHTCYDTLSMTPIHHNTVNHCPDGAAVSNPLWNHTDSIGTDHLFPLDDSLKICKNDYCI